MKWLYYLLATSAASLLALVLTETALAAPGDITQCSAPINLSNSEGYTSADPFMISDPAGLVHLFWAERQLGGAGGGGTPDTIMYAAWDGERWSQPNDILISDPRLEVQRINAIRGTLDSQGHIHLIWIGPENHFYYSSAHADLAGSAQAWQPQYLIADDQSGTQYSADIVVSPSQTVHLVYGRAQRRANQSIDYIRSTDGGVTWEDPVSIHVFVHPDRGPSNVRVYVDPPSKIYMTWTEWDLSGNGQAVYFARSLDDGLTWQPPILLAERAEGDYERDWTNLTVLGENQLMVLWEGGFRAYPQAQYSEDGGATWSEPRDTFPWLIADNGYGEFVRDSAGRLHVFLARRIREGYSDKCPNIPGCSGTGNAIWHSVWDGGRNWREPKPLPSTFSNVNFIAVGGIGGNQVAAAWFDYTDFEINTMACEIEGAPATASQPRPAPTPIQPPTPVPTPTALPNTPVPTAVVASITMGPPSVSGSEASRTSLGLLLIVSPALVVVGLTVLIVRYTRWN